MGFLQARDAQLQEAHDARETVRQAWRERLHQLEWDYVRAQVDEHGVYVLGTPHEIMEGVLECDTHTREPFKKASGGPASVVSGLIEAVASENGFDVQVGDDSRLKLFTKQPEKNNMTEEAPES